MTLKVAATAFSLIATPLAAQEHTVSDTAPRAPEAILCDIAYFSKKIEKPTEALKAVFVGEEFLLFDTQPTVFPSEGLETDSFRDVIIEHGDIVSQTLKDMGFSEEALGRFKKDIKALATLGDELDSALSYVTSPKQGETYKPRCDGMHVGF